MKILRVHVSKQIVFFPMGKDFLKSKSKLWKHLLSY